MGGIKYYQLAKGEELPDEFCAVRDVDGEPSEYTFYVPEAESAKLRAKLRKYVPELCKKNAVLFRENFKLRELARGLRTAYVGALNECEGMDSGLIWDHCEMVDAELAKSHARFEADRHRFDAAMSELGIEVDE